MKRSDIIAELRHFFDIEELVCRHTLAKWSDRSWQFLGTDYLHALLVIRRDILRKPMYCNDHAAGVYQRGLRCNVCPMVKAQGSVYLSAHVLGIAGDFSVAGMTAEEARQKIKEYQHLLPCPIRIEGGVSWLHIDTLPQSGVTAKVYEFTA